MKNSRFTESQIVSILKEADAGAKVKEVCRRHGISHSMGPKRVAAMVSTRPHVGGHRLRAERPFRSRKRSFRGICWFQASRLIRMLSVSHHTLRLS